jgi:hypothetical protein
MSSKICVALMESHIIGHIPVALALFSGMLAEPAFTTWEKETGVT